MDEATKMQAFLKYGEPDVKASAYKVYINPDHQQSMGFTTFKGSELNGNFTVIDDSSSTITTNTNFDIEDTKNINSVTTKIL
ncbi:MAG TPA: hypothetical protein DEP20_00210 [Fusobacteria bacterium]|nr:hypothetical protein [Fusobacteriota bacterium]|tara:strand:+ start:4922 stop:5167 length:246 start_codon:yes stop_codon:yes gene_type:complete